MRIISFRNSPRKPRKIPRLSNRERDEFFRAAVAAGILQVRGPTIDELSDPRLFGIEVMLNMARRREYPIWLSTDDAICLGGDVPAWFAVMVEQYAERVLQLMRSDFLGSWREPPRSDDLPRVEGWGVVQ